MSLIRLHVFRLPLPVSAFLLSWSLATVSYPESKVLEQLYFIILNEKNKTMIASRPSLLISRLAQRYLCTSVEPNLHVAILIPTRVGWVETLIDEEWSSNITQEKKKCRFIGICDNLLTQELAVPCNQEEKPTGTVVFFFLKIVACQSGRNGAGLGKHPGRHPREKRKGVLPPVMLRLASGLC